MFFKKKGLRATITDNYYLEQEPIKSADQVLHNYILPIGVIDGASINGINNDTDILKSIEDLKRRQREKGRM